MYRPYGRPAGESAQCRFTVQAVWLRDCFRLLWQQHVYWSRMAIISILMDLPDLEPASNRLLRNAPDFARLFKHFYGARAASEFNRVLTEHLIIAAELIKTVKTGDAAEDAEKRWYTNADEIVAFMHCINAYWRLKPMRAMWYEYLALLKAGAVARLSGNYTREIEIFNQTEQAALLMADEFSRGITCQFRLND